MFNITDFPKKKKGQLNIYMHISENSGVGYYRQFLPAVKIRENKLANVLISDFRWGKGDHVEPDNEQLFKIANWADLIVVGRKDTPDFLAKWGGIREFFNMPIVMDNDDNVYAVRPHNPGYQGYHPGSEATMWHKYGSSKVFDAMTVSTQNLVELYKKEIPNIYLAQNNIDVEWWDSFQKKEYEDGKIRIGFLGSSAHLDGVRLIRKPIINILQKYPQTLFYITHVYYDHLELPDELKDRVVKVPWIDLEQWPKEIKELGLDIGLAPLTDNLFNRAKSNLRWMEYAIAKTAPIVSPVEPYLCVKDGIDGLYAKTEQDWEKAMEKLVLDRQLCYTIANTSYERIRTEFNARSNVWRIIEIYKKIYNKYHKFFGEKKLFFPVKQGKITKYKKARK